MKQLLLALSLLTAFVLSSVTAQENVLAEIRNLAYQDVKMDGFVLDKDQEVSITAVGAGDRTRDLYTTAWILSKQTRAVAWKLRNAKERHVSRGLAEYSDQITLPKGEYEVYYATFPDWSENIEGFGDFMEYLADRIFHPSRRRGEYRDLSITVRGAGMHVDKEGVEQWHEQLRKDALVSLSGLWDNDYVHQGFILDKPMELALYAVGEANDDATYDYGWILDTKTGERVWQMTDRNTRHAGGARKNRMISETISLPAGKYVAYFVTDGSHSNRDWNAPPPYDPPFWGLTVRLKDESLRKDAKTFDYKAASDQNLIVDLTRFRDDEFQSKAITLNKALEVRVTAVGEGRDGEMSDYGWIVDAKTRKKLWTMEYGETEHAGGDQKNRMVNKVLHLDKGSYIVYFVTDGSHSYRDWNAAPPFDPEHWGISLNALSEGFNPNDVSAYEEREDKSVLARIVGVRDDERRRESFTLTKRSDVRIYALGEGQDGDMADYAWIEDANTGKVVWEMTYRTTEYAGGARKNRLFDNTISLPAGKYTVFYETDGSHAFNDWNDDPPDDPSSWGVTVSLIEETRR
jgi:predicted small secreted protein